MADVSFEPHRRALFGVAYRMLGSAAEAEDVVQEAFLRWQALSPSVAEKIDSPLRRGLTTGGAGIGASSARRASRA